MGVVQDTREMVAKGRVTVIDGQITQEDFTKLVQELCQIGSSIPTSIGGGTLGHVGLILNETDYVIRSNGAVPFEMPENPGPCPETLSDDPTAREREMAEHKYAVKEYEQCIGMQMGLRDLIIQAVPKEHLAGITDKLLGLSQLTIQEILNHLVVEGADLEDFDVEDLMGKMMESWSINESPAVYFDKQDEYEEQLIKAGIERNPILRLRLIKAAIKATGEYDIELAEWERKADDEKTFRNFRPFFQKQWAKKNSKNRTNSKAASYGIANNAQEKIQQQTQSEQEVLAELLALIQGESDKKMEKFMKNTESTLTATTKALEALTTKVNGNRNRNRGGGSGGGNKPEQCPHCKKTHYEHSKCWELDANASKRPVNWKSVKAHS
jgi:hypothetical protein